MKTKLSLAAAALSLFVIALIGSPATTATAVRAGSVRATPYSNHCARCHGGDGRSQTAKGIELEADDLTTAKVQRMSTSKLTRIIKNGKGDMPGFKNLSASQIASIIRTVKSF